jgi:hypothetical protein
MQPQWSPYLVEVPITIGSLDAFTAEDVVGGSTLGYVTFDNPLPQVKGGGYIAWVRLTDDADQSEPYRIYIYDNAPSTIAEDAAFAPTEADWLKTLGCITIAATDYDTSGADACAFKAGKDVKTGEFIIFDNLDTGKLYFRFVANASTPDYADADDLTFYVCLMLM